MLYQLSYSRDWGLQGTPVFGEGQAESKARGQGAYL